MVTIPARVQYPLAGKPQIGNARLPRGCKRHAHRIRLGLFRETPETNWRKRTFELSESHRGANIEIRVDSTRRPSRALPSRTLRSCHVYVLLVYVESICEREGLKKKINMKETAFPTSVIEVLLQVSSL